MDLIIYLVGVLVALMIPNPLYAGDDPVTVFFRVINAATSWVWVLVTVIIGVGTWATHERTWWKPLFKKVG